MFDIKQALNNTMKKINANAFSIVPVGDNRILISYNVEISDLLDLTITANCKLDIDKTLDDYSTMIRVSNVVTNAILKMQYSDKIYSDFIVWRREFRNNYVVNDGNYPIVTGSVYERITDLYEILCLTNNIVKKGGSSSPTLQIEHLSTHGAVKVIGSYKHIPSHQIYLPCFLKTKELKTEKDSMYINYSVDCEETFYKQFLIDIKTMVDGLNNGVYLTPCYEDWEVDYARQVYRITGLHINPFITVGHYDGL